MFERFVCWDKTTATRILRPLALEGNEAVFRATHSPISGLVIDGTEAHDVLQPTEEALLKSLSSSERRHAMCVVEGEAGSGKSHLIRWLKVYWPEINDLVVLIERADGTLDGTLRQLKEKLSKEAGASLESIVPQRQLTDQGQRESLLALLGSLCRSGALREPLGDEEWCDKNGVSDALQATAVRTSWRAPERVLDVLTRGADRDSRVARFTARDILELKQPLAGLKGKNVGPGAIKLAHALRQEAPAVESALEICPPGQDEPDLSEIAPNTAKFLAAINGRLNVAVQSAMGISGAALQKMFRDLRRTLFGEGRRLVLLLEDITGAQGVDQELLYVLQERSTTQDQYCDIVSVVGITPSYFRQYIAPQANVVQRITHQVRFGGLAGSFQAVSGLQDELEQSAFASRYLRAVRAGMGEIDQAYAERRAVTNACASCRHRIACQATFGEVNGVGLYPFTAKSIGRMFSSLRDPKGAMFLQTPRALIQAVLAPSIAAASAIEEGSFPVPSVETEWHPESKRQAAGLAHELIERTPDEFRERLRITVAWWGDGALPAGGDVHGEWAGVPGGVFRAFGIPQPASEPTAGNQGEEERNTALRDVGDASGQQDEGDTGNDGETANAAPPKAQQKSGTPRKPSGVKSAKAGEQLERIRSWVKTKKIEDDGFWSGRAKGFIEGIAWKDEDIPQWFVGEGLGEIRLQGAGKTDSRNVVIPCEPWAARGLEWSVRLESGGLAPGESDVALRAISLFAHKIRRILSEWVSARVPKAHGDIPWDFGATAAQVLLVRAWLRGETSPGAPLVEQWRIILSDDSPNGATRRPGAAKWNEGVDALAADWSIHKRLRDLARCDEPIADVSFIAPAIRALVSDCRFAVFPDSPPEQPAKTKWLTSLATSAEAAKSAFMDLPAKEISRLRERAVRVVEIAGSDDFPLYVKRASQAFERVRKDLPTVVPGELAEWFKLVGTKSDLLAGGPGPKNDRLRSFLATRPLESLPADSSMSVLLEHAINAPAESLEGIHDLLKQTSRIVTTLVNYLAPHEAQDGRQQDAGGVVTFGKRIGDKAAELKESLQ